MRKKPKNICSSNIVRRPQNLNQSSTIFDITSMQSARLIQDFAASSEYLNFMIFEEKTISYGTVRLFRILEAFRLDRSEIKNFDPTPHSDLDCRIVSKKYFQTSFLWQDCLTSIVAN